MVDQVGIACTGCSACYNICPQGAISMVPDGEGFGQPQIDNGKCSGCHLCEKVCPVLQKRAVGDYQVPKVYAAWHKDESIRMQSTSGGVFSALAETFMKKGGYVCGAVYDEQFHIRHVITNCRDDIPKLRQSKYAQSELGGVFAEIKNLLTQGEKVLFCGTPCQSTGLQLFLGKSYEGVVCCDFICRGVVSQKVYHQFLDDVAKRYHAGIQQVQFKNKDLGWNGFTTKLTMDDGQIYQKNRLEDYYMRGYLMHNLYLRNCCYDCRFKELPRKSDLSLGDFWGIGRYKKELDEDKGTSVVLINSPKGAALFEECSSHLITEMRCVDEVLAGNDCLLHAPEKGPYRDYFFKHLDRDGFIRSVEKVDEKAAGVTLWMKVKRALHRILK